MKKVLLLGSGALKIGEAGEFDYSGTQAIKALKEEGCKVVLVNPNVATIQTSQGFADRVYFVPITLEFVSRVIEKEKPDGILLSFGGQTALNCGLALQTSGILEKHHVAILGTPIEAILTTEDRHRFAKRLARIGIATAKGQTVTTTGMGLTVAKRIGYPVMVRSGFALGGTGSGIARNSIELTKILSFALATSSQVYLEESLWGWKEVEYEVVRDGKDNCITVCNMENMDPVGVHTGESIVVAPSQTLNDKVYYRLRQISIDVIRNLGVIGECNIQFAIHPKHDDIRIIEVNARLSRSSALASKATGYPLAYIAAKLALGKKLPDLINNITGVTSAFFEPSLDYIVVKIPRWDLDKFWGVKTEIGSEMKSVGEVMSIGRTFPEAIQKAARMLNDGFIGVIDSRFGKLSKQELQKKLKVPDSMRLFSICSSLRAGISIDKISKITKIDRWYISEFASIVGVYKVLKNAKRLKAKLLKIAKQYGFCDEQIALLRKTNADSIRVKRKRAGIVPYVKRIDTLAGEFPAQTNYLYLTYHAKTSDEIPLHKEKQIVVVGAGPYAIGTSVEFDWCAVNTIKTLRDRGFGTIMVNCNPETVSTDYDYSDKLYFEELTLERVLDIYDIEKAPFVCAVGGQIPNNLTRGLSDYGVPILGTQSVDVRRAEDRRTFSLLLDKLKIAQPKWASVASIKQARSEARRISYPVILRPSFVLSGKAMKVVASDQELALYLKNQIEVSKTYPMVMTEYLDACRECDVDGVSRNGKVIALAISEHVEPAGVHSGDSTIQYPITSIEADSRRVIERATKLISASLHIHGPFNIQFIIGQDLTYVIECNLRASRSMPFVSKTSGDNFIELATKVILDLPTPKNSINQQPFVGVKVPQFSFHKLRGSDPILAVEMRSTGEVASFGLDPLEAYFKAILSTGVAFPTKKAVLISLGGSRNKLQLLYGCQKLASKGFRIYATDATSLFLRENGIDATRIGKVTDRRPNVLDLLEQKAIDFAVIVPRQEKPDNVNGYHVETEGYRMRRVAIDAGIPVFTSTQTATYFILATSRFAIASVPVKPLEWYYRVQQRKEAYG